MIIRWKDHKAALTGASKRAIKGVFQFIHSVTSTAPIDTQDCFLSVTSVINDDPLSVVSTIGDGLSVGSVVNDDILSVTSIIKDGLSVVSSIDDGPLSVTSSIKDNLSVTSVVCNC